MRCTRRRGTFRGKWLPSSTCSVPDSARAGGRGRGSGACLRFRPLRHRSQGLSRLRPPSLVVAVPLESVPALLDAIALQTARLETIKAVLATRLATNSPRRESEAAPLTQEEAAERYE